MNLMLAVGLIIGALWIGSIAGFFLCAILRTGKQDDMWKAIEMSAYKDDNSMCRELLEMKD